MSGMDRLTDEALDEALLNQQCWDFVDWLSVTGSQLSGQSWNRIKPKLREMILAHRRASQAAPSEEWEACTCGPCPLHPAAPAPSDGLREAAVDAWNDAIEAAAGEVARYMIGAGAGSGPFHNLNQEIAADIRALRRAAPTEGEA